MAVFLVLLSRVYGFFVALRLTLYRTGYLRSKKLERFTISVGNITAGGTGKTPLVEYLAKMLINAGWRVNILTRGYGRERPGRQVVLNDGPAPLAGANMIGDEPLMLARRLPPATIVVNRDRFAGGTWAESHLGAEVHILDDGYQHLSLERDLNILVIDAERPFDSGELLPLGRMREPVAEIRRATAVVLTRTDRPFDQRELEANIRRFAQNHELPIFYAYHDVTELIPARPGAVAAPQSFQGRSVVALCAIGRPDLFVDDLRHFGMHVIHTIARADHARFSEDDLKKVFAEAETGGAEAVITTEKDWVRLEALQIPEKPRLWIARIESRMVDEAGFRSYVLQSMAPAKD